MVPVTLVLPQLQLTAPQGSTNMLEVSTNLTTWQDVTMLVFTSTNLMWVDVYPRGSAAYYRLRAIAPGSLPPFPAPQTNLVWIPPGQFVTGDQTPGNETVITLTKGFFIGKFEVTQGEYSATVGANPSSFPGEPNQPVETVSWQQATNYCRLLNQVESGGGRLPSGFAYRLPTEAEWEFAARAGASTRFSWGDDPNYTVLTNYAWLAANSASGTHVVGQKQPNAWGLYDTAGNVCEWCINSFNSVDTYPVGNFVDPVASAPGTTRVFRGGSYADAEDDCVPSGRRAITFNSALDIFGLRIVLAPTGP